MTLILSISKQRWSVLLRIHCLPGGSPALKTLIFFFFFFLHFRNWSIVDLQHCVSFRGTAQWSLETHSSVLAWKIPWTEEPGRLQSGGSQRVRHGWVTQHSTVVKGCVCAFPSSSAGKEVSCDEGSTGDEVWSLGREDPLEKGRATHSSAVAWRLSMNRGAWWAQSMGSQRVGHDWACLHTYLSSWAV